MHGQIEITGQQKIIEKSKNPNEINGVQCPELYNPSCWRWVCFLSCGSRSLSLLVDLRRPCFLTFPCCLYQGTFTFFSSLFDWLLRKCCKLEKEKEKKRKETKAQLLFLYAVATSSCVKRKVTPLYPKYTVLKRPQHNALINLIAGGNMKNVFPFFGWF